MELLLRTGLWLRCFVEPQLRPSGYLELAAWTWESLDILSACGEVRLPGDRTLHLTDCE